ncbi:hypothetical protein BV22DRAFT_764317 [Leucogyrophana mollusca]|uniref:Uncharacterized protein n=1 Tax=Leucogyrophana mollusca TaxID=85980 RepID=A0ACB8B5N3_9AGAM|nr:hypothetical protein BV22DRAFT_764317 [Leucogyrophana mollusca]
MSESPLKSANQDAPGAYMLQFGVHAGQLLRNVPDSYRYWATTPENSKYSWYSQFCLANSRYEDFLLRTRAPGAYRIPFSKYENKWLDEVPDAVRAWAIHSVHKDRPQSQFTPFVHANTRFEASLPPEPHINSEKFWVNKRSGVAPLSSNFIPTWHWQSTDMNKFSSPGSLTELDVYARLPRLRGLRGTLRATLPVGLVEGEGSL